MSRDYKHLAGLKENKLELLKQLLEQDGHAFNTFPLSFAQQRLWFLDQLEPGTPIYNIPAAVRLTGCLNVSALDASLQEIVRRHESLRTIFIEVGGRPMQVILQHMALTMPVEDLSGIFEAELEASVRQLCEAEAQQPFDLTQGPLIRVRLLQLGAEEHMLLLTLHHIVSDGWSTGILIREITSLYQSLLKSTPASLPELSIQYADFAVWQREWLQGEELETQLAYWRERLSGVPPILELPTDYPRPPVSSFRGARQTAVLDQRLNQQLKEFSQRESVTLFMTLLATFQTLLHRYTHQNDILVGTPIANRNQVETESLIGFFANTLVIRTNINGELSFSDVLQQVREVCLGAYAHQEVPFEKLVEELRLERSMNHTPLFQVLFVLRHASHMPLSLPGLNLQLLEAHSATAKFDLTFSVAEAEAGLECSLEYRTDLFEAATISRMLGHYGKLLEGVAADSQQKISEIALLTEAERTQLLLDWNQTESEYQSELCLHQLFERQALLTPHAIALLSSSTPPLSYRELNHSSNQLAHLLLARRLSPDSLVAICLDRSPLMLVALLAVLKAGAAYLPLDPAYPPHRLAFMLEDAGAALLLTHHHLLPLFPALPHASCFALDSDWHLLAHLPTYNPSTAVTSAHLAYLIYTSGSTGEPKGVAITHRSAVALVAWSLRTFAPEYLGAMLASTSICFDLSVFELFVPLAMGGSVILAENALQLPLLEARNLVRMINTVPSAMAELVRLRGVPESVRVVNLAGEALSRKLVEEVYALGEIESVHNLYGPSEDTTYSTWERVSLGESGAVMIGRPVANTRAYVVDESQELVPVGVAGELLLGGAGLARGYWHRPQMTAESFIPDRFSERAGERLYRTGDLCRYRADGRIEYLGRRDEQVKVRGYRVELGEVESVLGRHPSVSECVVVVSEQRPGEQRPGEQRLLGYVVGRAEEPALDIGQLRSFMAEHLPQYMIPSLLVEVEEMPLTRNGKVDRRALPAVDGTAAPRRELYRGARTASEEIICGIWSEVLGVEGVGVDENFFELGGHSLLATQVVSRMRESVWGAVTVRMMFERPTVGEMVKEMERSQGGESEEERIERRERGERGERGEELSFAQQRLWFLQEMEPLSAAYNMAGAVRLRGALDVGALESALRQIIARHEVLQTGFVMVDGVVRQQLQEIAMLSLAVRDLRGVEEEGEREAAVRGYAEEEVGRGFDLKRAPLMRVSLMRVGEREHVLVVVMHHIISDGWSVTVLVREMGRLYEAEVKGGGVGRLEELAIQYGDYAVWQRERMQGRKLGEQVEYWKEQLADAPLLLQLPTDRPRHALKSLRGATLHFAFNLTLTSQLRRLSRESDTTLFMTLLAGFQLLLARYSGQRDISVGSPIAGRTRTELEPLIGFFVNTLVLRTDLSGNPSFKQLLGRVREVCLGAYQHQDVPFEKLVEELQPERSLSHSPLFQVMFVQQNGDEPSVRLNGLEWEVFEVEGGTAKFDLSMRISERREGISGSVQYNRDLYEAGMVERMVKHYERIMRSVVEEEEECRGIEEIEMMSSAEREQMVVRWNETESEYEREVCVHQLFERQAELTPEGIALVYEDQRLTYAELNRRSNQLAHHLQSLGAAPESLVGICVERSPLMVVGILAILKAGAAYLPLDPAYPQQRLAFMLEDAQVEILLTQQHLRDSLPQCRETTLFCLDSDWAQIAGHPTVAPIGTVSSHNLAYVIYTSGSTGIPKGSLMSHAGLANLAAAQSRLFHLSAVDRVLQFASLSFDASVWECFMALTSGATLCLAHPDQLSAPDVLCDTLRRLGVTAATLPPALLNQGAPALLPQLRLVVVAGEACPSEVAVAWGTGRRFFNAYGPTEVTVCATVYECVEGDGMRVQGPPIGHPISNVRCYVLDSSMHVTALGVAGELYVGGAGLARGYLNRAELTAERFVPDQFSSEPGARLYRTGDVVRYREDGDLQFVGRVDEQVKVRGYRVELGEVESVLGRHPSVSECVVVVSEQRPGEQRLLAYVVGRAEEPALDIGQLRSFMAEHLPQYMIPSLLVEVEEMPLTRNGKVDRRALPAVDGTAAPRRDGYRGARTASEEIICGIWSEVLGVEGVGVDENFFELGGHSLLATQVVSRMRESVWGAVTVRMMFERPTVGEMVEEMERSQGEEREEERIERRDRGERGEELSYAQQRLWFLQEMEPLSAAYNMAGAVRLRGALDVGALESALRQIIARHEVLQTGFVMVDGVARQQLQEIAMLSLAVRDLRGVEEEGEREAAVRGYAEEEVGRGFDLKRAPLMRVSLMRVGEREHVLVVVMHHIISDGWSVTVLVREMGRLYEAEVKGGGVGRLEELAIQYGDYAVWQRERMQGRKLGEQVEYWKEQLADAPLLLQLPTDFPRPTRQSFDGGKESLRLSAGLSEQLMLMSRKQGVTLHMLLLTAFNILLSRYSGQEDIVVGTPTAGRERKEIESLIGCFINTLALRTDLSGNPSFKQLLGRVREVCLGAYQHQDVPFEKLVEELRPERSLSHTPLFQVYFNMLNLPEATVELPDLLIEHMSAPETGSKFDLTLYVKEQAAGILFALVYNTALFGQPRMAILLEQFEHLLSQIADRPEAQISCFSLVTPGTEKRLPDPAQDLPSHWQGAVTTLFALQAQKHPENLAVMDYQEAWTYQELDERSNRLARYLLAREIPQEGVVAVYAHRSAALVWALLGILKAGAMFVILDPAYPEERLIDYLKASGAKGFLQIEAAGELPPRLTERVADSSLGCRLRLGRKACAEQASAENVRPELQKALWETDNVLKDFPATDPCVAIGPDTLAYIGFTSGSTGKPKGIVGKHQSLALFGRWLEERFDINESDRFSMLSGLSHDPLQRDIFTTLQIGAGLFIPDPKEMGQPGWLTHWLKREEISVINLTPAMGQLLSEMAPRELQGGLTSLRYAFYVGDALTRGDIKRLRQIAPSVTCINLYGATETQRALSYYLVGADQDEVSSDEQTKNLAAREVLPVGIGIKEVQLLVLNKFEQLAGVGEVGEVCFRSPHLARGYLEDSALTHQKFIVNPLTRAPHDRLYRSGDLGRYLPDGDVALMGRQDFQVQIRGFRIELGEVESVLYRHAAVGACAVIAREDVPGDKRLVGYIVPGEGEPPTASHLRAFLRAHLPEFMVPHTFINLTALPLTPNGKVDRRALPAPEQAMAEREHVAPRTPIEKSLAEIWENLLGQTRVGVHDNFFELGGHSLLATRVISHLRDATDVELTLRTLFESPTIADLAVIVVQKQAAQRQSHEIEEIITGLEQLTEDELRNMLTGERGLETDAQRLLSSVTAQQLVEPSAGTDETGMA